MVHIKVFKFNYKIFSVLVAFIIMFTGAFIYTSVKATNKDLVYVPIIMYHSILKSQSGDYIIHPDTLEEDLKYIKENGFATITMTDLINYVYKDCPLPEKPIIITFDDGHYNNLTYAVPLLEKYGMVAVISIVGKYTDSYSESDEANPNYSYLRWKDIQQLTGSNVVEFQNHTYDLHNNTYKRKGCMKNKSESKKEYEVMLYSDIYKLQQEFEYNVGYIPNTFTYPFGAISKDSLNIIKKLGFKASLSCNEGINAITKNPECLYQLKRFNRPGYISTYQFFNKIIT